MNQRDSLELASLASDDEEEFSDNASSRRSLRARSSGSGSAGSVLSTFSLESALLPLSSTTEPRAAAPGLERLKHVSFVSGFGFVASLQIGSGIFASPGQVNSHVGSVGASLLAWLASGLLAWTGASSYAELGGAIPLNGAEQAYLQHIYGPLPGFLFSFCAILVLKPSSAAIIALICADYISSIILDDARRWVTKLVALGILATVGLVNIIGTKWATRVNDSLLVVKLAALLAVTITGLVVMLSGRGENWTAQVWTGTSRDFGEWALALYAGLWAFDGWNNANFITAELKNARRDLPRIIHTAMPTVIVAYLLANIAYYSVLPPATIKQTDTVALEFGRALLGRKGGVVLAVAVAFSCLGALNSTTFTSARLIHSAAKEGYFPHALSQLSRSGAPMRAVVVQCSLTVAYILAGEFAGLVTFYGVAGYLFYFFAVRPGLETRLMQKVLGVLVLRVQQPQLERPYRTWLTTPVTFCCVALFLLARGVISAPVQSVCVVAFVACGIPVYYVQQHSRLLWA